MSGTIEVLLLDMLTWLAPHQQPYAEVMDAWRTSCPRLTVWEDAVERGLVEHACVGRIHVVRISPAGRAFLAERSGKLSHNRAVALSSGALGGMLSYGNGSVHS